MPLDRYLRRLPLLRNNAVPEEPPTFAGMRVVVSLHAFQNLLAVAGAMVLCGLDPRLTTVFVKMGYRYPRRRSVLTELERAGFEVLPVSDISEMKPREIVGDSDEPVLIVEDGGHVTTRLLTDPSASRRVIGVVEQTTKGIMRLQRASGGNVPFPVVSVPHSELKRTVEPPYVAEAAVRAVQAILGHRSLRHTTVTVLGAGGTIGAELVQALEKLCVNVKYFDSQPNRLASLLPKTCGTLVRTPQEAVQGATVVFGATGSCSVGVDLVPYLADGVWLASVSSDQVEFDLEAFAQRSSLPPRPVRGRELQERLDSRTLAHAYLIDGKTIHVLLDGQPVNFGEWGQMPDDTADLVMTIVFLCAVDAARRRLGPSPGILLDAADAVAERHDLANKWLDIVASPTGGVR